MTDTIQTTRFTQNILSFMAAKEAKPVFESQLYPDDYAHVFIQAKGHLFMPQLGFYGDFVDTTYSQREKMVEAWANQLEKREAELWCDIADAYLVKNGIPLDADVRRDWLATNG